MNADEADTLLRLESNIAAWRHSNGKSPLECVVGEKDWPEFELTWQLIEERVTKTVT